MLGARSRAVVALPFTAGALAIPIASWSGVGVFWTLAAFSTLIAVAMSPRASEEPEESRDYGNLSVAALTPVGLLVGTAVVVPLSILAAALAPGVLQERPTVLAVWSILVLGVWVACWRRGGLVHFFRGDGVGALVGLAVMLLGIGVAVAQPFESWSRYVAGGTDFNRHLVFVRQIVGAGGLEFESNSYPRGLHSLVALVWSASGGKTYADAWQALESSLWLVFCLIAVSLAVVAVRVFRLFGFRRPVYEALVGLGLLVFLVQSVWVTAVFALGFITTMFAGLVLAATMALGVNRAGRWFGSPASLAWFAVAVGLLAYTWTLLIPVAVAGALGAGAVALARRRSGTRASGWLRAVLIASVAALVTLPAIVSQLRDRPIQSGIATAGYSGMLNPEFWWYAIAVTALIVLLALRTHGLRGFPAVVLLMILAGAAGVAVIGASGPGPGAELNYYASKTLWTLSVLPIPLAVAGLALAANAATDFIAAQNEGWTRLAAIGAFGLVLSLFLAAATGRMSGSRSIFLEVMREESPLFPTALPTVAELEARNIDFSDGESPGALVWGILPGMTPATLDTPWPGLTDWQTREGTAWLNAIKLQGSPLFQAGIYRDAEEACTYLRVQPKAIRVTGPDPSAGADWLIAAGCPEDVVRPAEWISVPIGPMWFEGTRLEGELAPYPTYDEFQAYLAEQEALRNQQTPTPSQN